MYIYSGLQIAQHKRAWPFLQPVDVGGGLGMHDYYKVKFISSSNYALVGMRTNLCYHMKMSMMLLLLIQFTVFLCLAY